MQRRPPRSGGDLMIACRYIAIVACVGLSWLVIIGTPVVAAVWG